MKKIGIIFSGIFIVIGVITMLTTTIINLLLPKLGFIANQTQLSGRYNPVDYSIDFFGVNIFALCLLIFGVIFSLVLFISEKRNTNTNQDYKK